METLAEKALRIRILIFDIDGTTYQNDIKDNPASTKKALAQLRQAGYRLAICTSRSRDEMVHLPADFLASMDAVASVAGGQIDADGRRDNHWLDADQVAAGMAFLDSHEMVYRWVDGQGHGYLNRHQPRYDGFFSYLYDMVPPLKDYDGRPLVHILYYTDDGQLSSQARACFDRQNVVDFAPCHEVTACGVDKAASVRRLAALFGLDAGQAAVFGDGGNDVGMLRAAGVGIAMGNACPACRQAADYVTDAIQDDGLYNACVRMGWIR